MSFSRIIGQELPLSIIRNSLQKDRVANAYLFYGPAGVGKKLMALNLAKLVNCLQAGDEPCDECHSCRRIDDCSHPDVYVIAKDVKARDLKIDQIRQLEDNIYLKPFEAKRKVFIIDGAGDMNEQAQNALLKTLEEPPGDSVLILLAENIQNLLETIRSRCLRLRFNRLSVEQIEKILVEKYELDEESAGVLARVSEGSLEKASGSKEYLDRREDIINTLLSGFSELSHCEEWTALDREEAGKLLKFVSGWCRDTVLIKLGVDEKKLLINPDYSRQLSDFGSRYDIDRLLHIIERIHETIELIDGNVNTQLALEVLWDNV